MKGDLIWYNDVSVLPRHWTEFFPSRDHTSQERVNALVRLVAYATLAAFAYNRQPRTLVMGAATIAVVSVAFSGSTRTETYPNDSSAVVETAEALSDRACTKPTRDNPFGNVLLTDLCDASRPPACAYDSVKDDITAKFNDGLFRNSSDVYQKENSQRQFMTMPVTTSIPDTGAFANFLYGNMKSCKTFSADCPSRM
jgi:hypothetical protein